MSRNICRTCLQRYDSNNPATYKNMQDFVFHGMIKIKLIDLLVFLNCIDIDVEEHWPPAMCATCVSAAVQAFCFKRKCLESNDLLTRYSQSRPTSNPRMENIVYLDHQYDVQPYHNPYPVACTLT